MKARTTLRYLAVAGGLCAAGAVLPPPAGAQGGAEPEEKARAAADRWAEELINALYRSPDREAAGTRLALRPLNPLEFAMNDRYRWQIYDWMASALRRADRRYVVVDRARFFDIYRAMDEVGAKDPMAEYLEVLKKSRTRINVTCRGNARGKWIVLNCSATDIETGHGLGDATASFESGWLPPAPLDYAVGSVAGDIAAHLPAPGRVGETRIVDGRTGEDTPLSKYVASLLRTEVTRRLASRPGWRAVGGDEGAAHRLDGDIHKRDDRRLALHVRVLLGRAIVHAVREDIDIASVREDFLKTPSVPDPAKIWLPDGISAADWALLAEERMKGGEFTLLLAEANAHIRKHGPLAPFVEVRERAVSGLAEGIRVATKAEARAGLKRIARIEASVGTRPDLSRLKARAHRILGDAASEKAALAEWLKAAARDHPERREVLSALGRVRALIVQGETFAARVGRPFSPERKDGPTGWTDLHSAALLDLPAVTAALIDAGTAADVRLKDDSSPFGGDLGRMLSELHPEEDWKSWRADGETPSMIAALANARAAMAALVARGADTGANNRFGGTPLHYAARANAREAMEWLAARGADIGAKDKSGETPLNAAAKRGLFKLVERFAAPGVYLDADVSAGQKIDPRQLRVLHAERIPAGRIRNYSMVARGCYSVSGLSGDRLDWSGVSVCGSR